MVSHHLSSRHLPSLDPLDFLADEAFSNLHDGGSDGLTRQASDNAADDLFNHRFGNSAAGRTDSGGRERNILLGRQQRGEGFGE